MAEQLAAAADPVQRTRARLNAMITCTDVADALQVIAVPPLFIDVLAAEYMLPAQRCVDDCLILAHAYHQLGLRAQVRAAQLTITDTTTGQTRTHGDRRPRWEDGILHGHTIVWLPVPGYLVDVTAEQFEPIADLDQGPVIAACRSDEPDNDARRVTVRRSNLRLVYELATEQETTALLDQPIVHGPGGHGRRGMNVASVTISLLARLVPRSRHALIPHPRAAALVAAIRDLPEHRTPDGDLRFITIGPEGEGEGEGEPVQLDQLRLPDNTPPLQSPWVHEQARSGSG